MREICSRFRLSEGANHVRRNPEPVPRINLLTSGMNAELHALLDLQASRTFQEFWGNARRLLRSALLFASAWFAPADWLLPCADFGAETPFESEADFELPPILNASGEKTERNLNKFSRAIGTTPQ